MPVFSDGQKISAALAWDRMIQSVPASYVVWKDGSTYRAECLLKGGTDYSGTDAATVLQSAINNLNNAGVIFFRAGQYLFEQTVTIPGTINVVLEGELFGSYPQREKGAILIKNFDGVLLDFTGDNSNKAPSTIRNLAFNAHPTGSDWSTEAHSGNMININYRRHFTMENVKIYRNLGNGIYITNTQVLRLRNVEVSEFKNGSGVWMDGDSNADWQIWDLECNVGYSTDSNTENGLTIKTGSGQIHGGHFEGYYGIYSEKQITVIGAYIPWCVDSGILSTASGNIIDGNTIVNGNTGNKTYGSGIRVGSKSTVANNYVAGSLFKYGVYTYDNSVVHGNIFEGLSGATEIVHVGSNCKVYGNEGFVTENGGTATISNGNTSIVVNHGCDYTPSAKDIDVHPIESLGSASFWWVDTITSTQFTIHVNADPGQDVDFKWSVRRI